MPYTKLTVDIVIMVPSSRALGRGSQNTLISVQRDRVQSWSLAWRSILALSVICTGTCMLHAKTNVNAPNVGDFPV